MGKAKCEHCGAKRPNLHLFEEMSFGTPFKVVRCLLCGWQISQQTYYQTRVSCPGASLPTDPDEFDEWKDIKVPDFALSAFEYATPTLGVDF